MLLLIHVAFTRSYAGDFLLGKEQIELMKNICDMHNVSTDINVTVLQNNIKNVAAHRFKVEIVWKLKYIIMSRKWFFN